MRAATTLAACAAIGLAAAIPLGFGRFSYALVLPAMQSDLGLTYAEAGALNSANALGHLLGAILAIGLLVRVSLATAVIDDGTVSAQVTPGAGVNDKTLVLYPMEQAATVLAHAAKFHKSASDRGGLLAAVGETSGDTFAAHPYREFGHRDATVTKHRSARPA